MSTHTFKNCILSFNQRRRTSTRANCRMARKKRRYSLVKVERDPMGASDYIIYLSKVSPRWLQSIQIVYLLTLILSLERPQQQKFACVNERASERETDRPRERELLLVLLLLVPKIAQSVKGYIKHRLTHSSNSNNNYNYNYRHVDDRSVHSHQGIVAAIAIE